MRRLALIAAMVVMAGTASAQEQTTTPVFGGGACGRPFSCSAVSNTADIIAKADLCVRQLFGMGGNNFDDGQRFDSSNCIMAKDLPKAATGFTMSAKCCVTPTATGDACQLNCTQYGIR